MAVAHLLGIDIGTTGVRAAIFDSTGTLHAEASVSCHYDSPEPGRAEVRPERWWHATQTALEALSSRSARVSLADVTGIGVVGQAPTAVLVDADGTSLAPAVLWLDTRADTEARELGVPAYYLGPKLLWLSRHGAPLGPAASDHERPEAARNAMASRAGGDGVGRERDVLSRARWILQSHAFIVHRLTGQAAIDPSTAALCSPLFDLAARAWIPSACAATGVREQQLPPVRAAHEVIGHVTAQAARTIGHGLREGTPVVAGGGDFAAATLGAGVVHEGESCLMLGTAGNLLVPRKTPGTDARLINAHHVGADGWLSLGGTLSGGAQEWLRHALTRASSPDDTAVRNALPPLDVLDAEAESTSTGADGLLFLPYLLGERTPIWDVNARGAFIGLSTHHGRGHLWRAVLEGIALGFVDCQEVLEQDGVRLRDVVAANGGGKSSLFRQILCDALGVPLSYTPDAGGTVAGAAILAALGTGALRSPEEARAWRRSSVKHEPDSRAHERYRERLVLRREAYAGLRPVFAGLTERR